MSAFRRAMPRDLFSGPAAALVIALLMAAYVAGYAWSAPNTDSADELLRAYEIVNGIAFPMQGPPLGGVLHLGPFWFYLTALPLLADHSWLAAALFIGFVCSLKFPLAYWCGKRLVDEDFGVLWAAALFLPGWTTVEQLVFLNPNGVAMAMLAVLAVALPGIERPAGLGRCLALGVALALALHVHPTSLPVFLLAPAVLWARFKDRAGVVLAAIAMAAGFAVPFVPYVVAQAMSGFADWTSASGYVAKQVFVGNIVNAPQVVAAYLVDGPRTMAGFLLQWPADHAAWLGWGTAALATASLAAAFGGALARTRLLQLLVLLALTAAWIAIARPTTPVQFTWALAVPVGGLIALGLQAIARTTRFATPLVLALVAGAFFVNVMVVRALVLMVQEGEGRLPSLILDIKAGLPETVYRDVWFPAHRHDELGRSLCAAGGPAQLHGHLAYVVDKDLGLDTLFECRDRSLLALAGSDGTKHHAGMTRPFWRAISGLPECYIGSLGLTRSATPLLPRRPIPLADGATYLPRKTLGRPAEVVTLELSAPTDRAVLLTNVLGSYELFEVQGAQAGGQAVQPAAANDLSALYAPPPGSASPVRWRFSVRTTHVEAIDAISLPLRPDSPQPMERCLIR